jgi:very-short-patch-repair endonuclease
LPARGIPPPSAGCDFEALRRDILVPGGARAARSYREWLERAQRNPDYGPVQAFVHAQRHDTLHALAVAEVERIAADPDPAVRTGHALGRIRKDEPGVIATRDFSTPWAIAYLLHGLLESMGRVPRWQDVDRHLRGAASSLYYGPFTQAFRYGSKSAQEIRAFERGFQYRVGNAYYSFLREVDLMARLREIHGLQVRYHVLADVHYRVDFWCRNVLVALWVENPRYRQGNEGRKPKPEHYLDASGFRLLRLELDRPDQRNSWRPMLFSTSQVAHAAEQIRAALITS